MRSTECHSCCHVLLGKCGSVVSGYGAGLGINSFVDSSHVSRLFAQRPWASRSLSRASVTEQYNLIPAKANGWWWCSASGNVTAGLVESRAIFVTKTKTRTKMIAIRLLKLKLELYYSKKLKLY